MWHAAAQCAGGAVRATCRTGMAVTVSCGGLRSGPWRDSDIKAEGTQALAVLCRLTNVPHAQQAETYEIGACNSSWLPGTLYARCPVEGPSWGTPREATR